MPRRVVRTMTLLFLLQACAAGSGGGSAGSGAGGGFSTRVLWRVAGYVIGRDASWGEREARAQLFKPLDISPRGIAFDGRVCTPVRFRKETVRAGEFLAREWQVTPRELGIEDQGASVVTTDCDIPGFGKYLQLKDRRLVVRMQGVYFFLAPVIQR